MYLSTAKTALTHGVAWVKTRMMSVSDVMEKCALIKIQYDNVTDGRTDGEE